MEKAIIEPTPEAELAEILEQQKREAEWYTSISSFETVGDMVREEIAGDLVRIKDGSFFRISAKVAENHRFLRPKAKALLERIAEEWARRMKEGGEAMENTFLVVSSLSRTVDFQKKLKRDGYPATEGSESTHTKGWAFDIAVRWFEKNRPHAAEILHAVLAEKIAAGINLIEEPAIGVLHVAVKP